MTEARRAWHREAEKLALELTYPDRLTPQREAYIYARIVELDALIYG